MIDKHIFILEVAIFSFRLQNLDCLLRPELQLVANYFTTAKDQ